MQGQTYGIEGLATLEAVQPLDWQAEALGDYEQSLPIRHADLWGPLHDDCEYYSPDESPEF